MTTTISTRQLSTSAAVVEWATDTPPGSWEIEREGPGIFTTLAVVEADARLYVDDTLDDSGLAAGDVVTYRLVDPAGPTVIVTATALTLADTAAPFTYGPVDPLASTIRYTTLDEVKQALGITDTALDAELTQTIIAGEVAIDTINGRSFPDTGVNPEIPGIPAGVKVWAKDVAVEVWKLTDTAAGFTAGADDWVGTIDVLEAARRAIRRNPLALGWRVAWGIA